MTVYEYKGTKVFRDPHFVRSKTDRDAIAAILAQHFPPKPGDRLPYSTVDNPDHPVFLISCEAVVDGWDICREFYVRLPSLEVAQAVAEHVTGYAYLQQESDFFDKNYLNDKYNRPEVAFDW